MRGLCLWTCLCALAGRAAAGPTVLRWREVRGGQVIERAVALEGDRVSVSGPAAPGARAVPGLGARAAAALAAAHAAEHAAAGVPAAPCGAPLLGWLEAGGITIDLADPHAWRRYGAVARVMLAGARGEPLEVDCRALRLAVERAPAGAADSLPALLDLYLGAAGEEARLDLVARLAALPDAEPFWADYLIERAPGSAATRRLLSERSAALVRAAGDADRVRRLLALLDTVRARPEEEADLLWQRAALLAAQGDERAAGRLRRRFYQLQGRDGLDEDVRGIHLEAGLALSRAFDFDIDDRLRALCALALEYETRALDQGGAGTPLGGWWALRAAHYARRVEMTISKQQKKRKRPLADARLEQARGVLARVAGPLLARPLYAWPMRARLELCDLAAHLRRQTRPVEGDDEEKYVGAGRAPAPQIAADLERLVRFGNLNDAEILARSARAAARGEARGQVDMVYGDALAAVELDERAALAYARAAAAGAPAAEARRAALGRPHSFADDETAAGASGAPRGTLAAALARLSGDPVTTGTTLLPLVRVRDAAPAALALAAAAAALAPEPREASKAERARAGGRRALGDLLAARALASAGGDPDVQLTLAEIWTTSAARLTDARRALAEARISAPDRARGFAAEARLAELSGDLGAAARAADAAANLRPLDVSLRELRRRTRLALPQAPPAVAGAAWSRAHAAPTQ